MKKNERNLHHTKVKVKANSCHVFPQGHNIRDANQNPVLMILLRRCITKMPIHLKMTAMIHNVVQTIIVLQPQLVPAVAKHTGKVCLEQTHCSVPVALTGVMSVHVSIGNIHATANVQIAVKATVTKLMMDTPTISVTCVFQILKTLHQNPVLMAMTTMIHGQTHAGHRTRTGGHQVPVQAGNLAGGKDTRFIMVSDP